MIDLGSGVKRQIQDIALTRHACYLIAQNGDPAKEPIAFAQTYFAAQTHKPEIIGKHLAEGIAAAYDSENRLVGLEILDAGRCFGGQDMLRQLVLEGVGPSVCV